MRQLVPTRCVIRSTHYTSYQEASVLLYSRSSRSHTPRRLTNRPWFALVWFLMLSLPLAGRGPTLASPGGQAAGGLARLGPPVVTTGSDAVTSKIAPDVLQEARRT